ncbi:MAG: response regulator [Deltaproteobacteria bacterium]
MSKRILVIDDDKFVRESFVFVLEDEGYSLDTADSGEKGVEKLSAQKYDLVFLDLKMPGMDGIETLGELRKIDKQVPVYIITAFHQEFLSQLKEAERDGLNFELVSKPLNNEKITLVIKIIFKEPQIL